MVTSGFQTAVSSCQLKLSIVKRSVKRCRSANCRGIETSSTKPFFVSNGTIRLMKLPRLRMSPEAKIWNSNLRFRFFFLKDGRQLLGRFYRMVRWLKLSFYQDILKF